mgnify:CR=1 FL=1
MNDMNAQPTRTTGETGAVNADSKDGGECLLPTALMNPTLCGLLLFLFPFVLGPVIGGKGWSVKFLSGDVYYYFVVARNYLDHGITSFDGEYATNGFHPLWQGCVILITSLSDGLGLSLFGLCALTLFFSVLIVAVALLILAACFRRALGSVPWLFCLLPLGICGVIGFLGTPWAHLSLWSYANGMESGLVLPAYSCWLYFAFSKNFLKTPGNAAGVGTAFAFLVLARLDHVFFVIPVAVVVVIRCLMRPSNSAFAYLIAIIIPAGTLLAYMFINLHYVGFAMPVSGAIKSTYPNLCLQNFVDVRDVLSNPLAAESILLFFRLVQVFVPAMAGLFVVGYSCFSSSFRAANYWRALFFTAVGTVMLALSLIHISEPTRPY